MGRNNYGRFIVNVKSDGTIENLNAFKNLLIESNFKGISNGLKKQLELHFTNSDSYIFNLNDYEISDDRSSIRFKSFYSDEDAYLTGKVFYFVISDDYEIEFHYGEWEYQLVKE